MILIVIKRHMPCDGGSLLHGHIADTGNQLQWRISRYQPWCNYAIQPPHFTRVLHQLRYIADIKMVIEFIAR